MKDLYSLYLVVNLLVWLYQILSGLDIAACAVAIMMVLSGVELPSLERVATKYLKLLTSLL